MEIAEKGRMCAESIISEMGYELVDVEYAKDEGVMCLTFYIFQQCGVSLEDCEKVSSAIEAVVEEADVTNGKPYYLCVSSPGERPLRTFRDFERNIGNKVAVELSSPIKGKKKKFVGILNAFNDDEVILSVNDDEITFKKDNIKTVRPYIGF